MEPARKPLQSAWSFRLLSLPTNIYFRLHSRETLPLSLSSRFILAPMSLTHKYGSPCSIFPSFSPNKRSAGAVVSNPFEDTLIGRLTSLLPIPDCSRSIPLPWISRAVDLLSVTLSDAASIISDPLPSSTDRAALSSLLDSSVALLDACNAISAAAGRILRGRLLICLTLHLISSSPSLCPDRRRRANCAITEWEALASMRPLLCGSTDLIHRLRPNGPNCGRLTAVHRVIYAVEAVSDLVARSSLAALGEKEDVLSGIIHPPGEFPWAASYNEVVAALSARLCGGVRAYEIEEAEASIRRLAAVVVVEDDGEGVTKELRETASGAEKAIAELTEGLELLTDAINRLFRVSLETREAALQCFRLAPGKCK